MTNEIWEDNSQVVFLSSWSVYTYLYSKRLWKIELVCMPMQPCSSAHRRPKQSVTRGFSPEVKFFLRQLRQFSNRLSLNRLIDWGVKSATRGLYQQGSVGAAVASSAGPNPLQAGRWLAKSGVIMKTAYECWDETLPNSVMLPEMVKIGTVGILKPLW